MIPTLILASMLGGFSSFSGTGSAGRPDTPRKATIAWYGDSITQLGGDQPPPAVLDSLLPGALTEGYTVQNLGLSGETAHEIVKRIIQGSATACVGLSCGYYVAQGGVNTLKEADLAETDAGVVAELALNGTGAECSPGTVAGAAANTCGMLDGIDYLHATHPRAKIFAIGVLPYAGCDNLTCPSLVEPGPRARSYNTKLQAACAQRAWLTCILPYTQFEDPNNPDYLRPDYVYADGIHLLPAGATLLGTLVYSSSTW